MKNFKKFLLFSSLIGVLFLGFLSFTNAVEAQESEVPCGPAIFGFGDDGGNRMTFTGHTGDLRATAGGTVSRCVGQTSEDPTGLCPKYWDPSRPAENFVVINHGGGYVSVYRNLTKVTATLQTGDVVSKGQPLGEGGVQGNPEYQIEMNGKMLSYDCIKCYYLYCELCECCPQEPAYCDEENQENCGCCYEEDEICPLFSEECAPEGCCIEDCVCKGCERPTSIGSDEDDEWGAKGDGCPPGTEQSSDEECTSAELSKDCKSVEVSSDSGNWWENLFEKRNGTKDKDMVCCCPEEEGYKTSILHVKSSLNGTSISGVSMNWGDTVRQTEFSDSITLPASAKDIQAQNISAPLTHTHNGIKVNFDRWEGCSSGTGVNCVVNFNPPLGGTEEKTVIAHYKGDAGENKIECVKREKNSITLKYELVQSENAYIFRGNVLVHTINSQDKRSGEAKMSDLKADTQYTFRLREGDSSDSRLLSSAVCSTIKDPDDVDEDDEEEPEKDDDGRIACIKREKNSITIKYSTNKTGTIGIFRGNTRVHLIESGDSRSGELKVDNLNPETSYVFNLRAGRFSYSPLLYSTTCKTTDGEIIIEDDKEKLPDKTVTSVKGIREDLDKVITKVNQMIKEQESGEGTPNAEIKRLTNEIARLTAIINEMAKQGVTVPTGGVPTACHNVTFVRNLTVGDRGMDIRCLQAFLNTSSQFRLAVSGPGSPGNETDYFGPITKIAVIKFQEALAPQILHPLGLTSGTGFVGSATRNALNSLLGR